MTELRTYIKHGPDKARSLTQKAIALWLWWRTWAMYVVILVGFSSAYWNPFTVETTAWAFLCGYLTLALVDKVMQDD